MGFKNIVSLPLQFFHVIFLQPTVNCLYDGGEIKHRAWSESRNVLYSCEMLWSRSHSLYYKLCYGAESSFCQLRALAPAPDPEVEVAFRIFLLYFLLTSKQALSFGNFNMQRNFNTLFTFLGWSGAGVAFKCLAPAPLK